MEYDSALIAGKLRRWEGYLRSFNLPEWESIPNIGLYMEQVVDLMGQYLDYLPPELREEKIITPTAINNYVRTGLLPSPAKKRYYRVHIAYLIMICTLKQSLSLALLQKLLPADMGEDEVREMYTSFAGQHRIATDYFVGEVRREATKIFDEDADGSDISGDVANLIAGSAVIAAFSRLLAEKLILLNGKTLANGGSIEIEQRRKS